MKTAHARPRWKTEAIIGILAIALTMGPGSAFAQNPENTTGASRSTVRAPKKAPTEEKNDSFHGEVEIRGDSFLSSDYNSTETKSFGYLGGKLSTFPDVKTKKIEKTNLSEERTGFQLEAEGLFAPQATLLSYINPQQLYFRYSAISIGRKKDRWSYLDDIWTLGVYNPMFRWNPLDPQAQGLTGLFLNVDQMSYIPWGISLMASPLFIPDQGASYQIKDGQFESVNPWFPKLPKAAQIRNVTDRVNYNIQKPETNDVVSNSSWLAKAYLGEPDEGFFIQGASAYKPSNKLELGYNGGAGGANPSTKATIDVDVTPQIYYQRVSSGDFRWSTPWNFFGPNSGTTLGVSALSEQTDAPKFDSEQTYALYAPSQLVSTYLELRYLSLETRASFITVQGGEAQVTGLNADVFPKDLFSSRYPYKTATKFEARNRYYWKKYEGFTLGGTYTQGRDANFELITTEAGWQFDRNWTTSAKLLMVKADAGVHDVYSDFENNDQMQLGVIYGF